MKNYDFGCLNDKEFEALATDLMSMEYGIHVERFKAGRDLGVDGRFFVSTDKEVVVQCKHWLRSGLDALLREIKKNESDKVIRLDPERYIFITSLSLSRSDKKKIKEIFSPYIKNDSDVFGNEDMNDLIARHKSVEQRHYKLWMSSVTVLKTILSAAIVGRSRFKLDDIIEDSALYVQTANHNSALKKLEEIHAVIITGEPGVGKTTLADQLCRHYAANGFELCYIENSLNEAELYYSEEEKQLYYFDDFLGRNFLEALNRHEDSHVINFMRRVEMDPKKRFVLTSRTTVLNQGKRLSDLFAIRKIERSEYEITISSLSRFEKAQILYNHIFFGNLDDLYVEQIYLNKRYRDIIAHKNFNPRLISFITDAHRVDNIDVDMYWEYIESTLDNPKDVWGNVFESQLDAASRHVAVAVAIAGKAVSENNLKTLFANLRKGHLSEDFRSQTHDRVMRLLVGSVINRVYVERVKTTYYDLFNPSIADYVYSNYLDDELYIEELIDGLRSIEAISNIQKLTANLYIDAGIFHKICDALFERMSKHNGNYSYDYILRLMVIVLAGGELSRDYLKNIKDFFELILNSDEKVASDDFYIALKMGIEFDIVDANDSRIIERLVDNLDDWPTESEYISLSELIKEMEPWSGLLCELFKNKYIDYLSDEITRLVIESAILPDYYGSDMWHAEREVRNLVEDIVGDLALSFDESELREISNCCDLDDVMQSNISASRDAMNNCHDRSRGGDGAITTDEAIDDLFDRG